MNYYIRSSILNQVISETDQTGKKLKTFVAANGATIAEQELVTISGTTSEKLSFIHQDASGASVQQTNAVGALTSGSGTRAGEYDALGRNVADASPFISLNSEPPPSEAGSSGIDLDGTSAGYRPGQQIYRIDGQVVSQASFMETVNSGQIGGAFGLLEITARMSIREIGRFTRTIEWGSENSNGVVQTNTASRTWIFYQSNNWSVIGLLAPQAGRQTQRNDRDGLPDYVKEIYKDKKLAKKLTDCINKVFNKMVKATRDGKTFEVLGRDAIKGQVIKNAPYVDELSFTGFELGGGTGQRAFGRVFPESVSTYEAAKQNNFIPGTVYIANDITDRTVNGQTFSAKLIKQKAYIHELGNILSVFLTGDGNYFGEPGGVPLAANPSAKPDEDTGAALEKCVFNTPKLIP